MRVERPLTVPPDRLNETAEAFARARVFNPTLPLQERTLLPMEIEYEKRRLIEPSEMRTGILYDGFAFCQIAAGLLGHGSVGGHGGPPLPAVRRRSHLHVVFTDQLVGTMDADDRRYHARTAVFSVPVAISSAGLVLAPARPREYYLAKHALRLVGKAEGAEALLGSQSAGRWLERGDPRMTDVAKGYAAQAVAFQLWGDPFCQDPACRLFNAHRQEEMIRAQLESGKLCEMHQDMFHMKKAERRVSNNRPTAR